MSQIDIEQGRYHESDVSICFSDNDDVGSCYSYFYSTTGGSYDCDDSRRASSVAPSEIAAEEAEERDCRICQLGVEKETGGGGAIELGCSCKNDLSIVHRQCAETWFKIKGDKICEICHSVARNIAGANEITESPEEQTEVSDGATAAVAVAVAGGGSQPPESQGVWQSQRLLNFLLACMVFAFFISWLFHFNVSS